MKKLKVILPAILTLAVSTSAAVTGTVAWFTATRLRTIAMTGVTVVNPEAGLEVLSVTNNANTYVTGTNAAQNFAVQHLTEDGTNFKYLRDASVDVNAGTVYRAELSDETGEPTAYASVASKYVDVNGKTYDNKPIVYATQFTAVFKVTSEPETADLFKYSLFLDFNASTVTAPTQFADNSSAAGSNDLNLIKSLRIGFKSEDNQWFVWAPLAETSKVLFTDPTNEEKAEGKYRAQYVNGTVLNTNHGNYTTDNLVVGNNGQSATHGDLNDGTGPLAKNTAESYIGYLADLNETGKSVVVTTWFEGLDPNCVNDNFSGALKEITSNLKFIMRRVLKA